MIEIVRVLKNKETRKVVVSDIYVRGEEMEAIFG